MTPAQLLMYCGADAISEETAREAEPSHCRIDPRTGHRIVRVESFRDAVKLVETLKRQKGRGDAEPGSTD